MNYAIGLLCRPLSDLYLGRTDVSLVFDQSLASDHFLNRWMCGDLSAPDT